MMCVVRAAAGNDGQFISHSCVDFIVLPSGIMIFGGLVVGLMLVTFAFTTIKCPVVPESNMP